jgi:putative membrane protein
MKAIHLCAVIFWMAGLLYLPRLFIYHSTAKVGGELEAKMEEAELKLLRIIMNPAMIVAIVLGIAIIAMNASLYAGAGWLHVKILLALALLGYHGYLSKTRKGFLNGGRPRSEKFYRRINEIPAIGIILIVILVIVRPF